jgi:hypothetical protein
MDTPNVTLTNGVDPDLAFAAVVEVERCDGELLSEKGAYMARCRAIRDRRKAVIEEYRDRGLTPRDLRDALKMRKLQAKLDAVRQERSTEDAVQLDMFVDAVRRGEAVYSKGKGSK